MIENARKTKVPHRGKKYYYLVMLSGSPVGVATNYDTARLYLSELAVEYKAEWVADNIYSFRDDTGTHLLSVQEVIRIKD